MIRGPVLPQSRESLWALVASRLEAIESGLVLALEGLDCSAGQLGLVEGLARDAMGAPVLVLLAVEGDALLPARVLSACEFLIRAGDALVTALPEAGLCAGVPGRTIVVGTEGAAVHLEMLCRLPMAGLQVCRLEPFRIAGMERFVVRWLGGELAGERPVAAPKPDFVVAPEYREHWLALQSLCGRLDPAVRMDGDRFWRRITWNGHLLGQIWSGSGELRVGIGEDAPTWLRSDGDRRVFGDRLVRRFVLLAGLGRLAADADAAAGDALGPERKDATPRSPGLAAAHPAWTKRETLRSTAASVRLSPEEYSALGSAAAGVENGEPERIVGEDGSRIGSVKHSKWPQSRRLD